MPEYGTSNVALLQKRLTSLGYAPGEADGIFGVRTRNAVRAFQKDHGLLVDGIVGPVTSRALNRAVGEGFRKDTAIHVKHPWLEYARSWLRRHEVRDNKLLTRFLRKVTSWIDPAKTAWCGTFVGAVFAVTMADEPIPGNPEGARNWLKFGKPVEPQLGAVLVFWRGSPKGWKGHVGFYVGEDASAFHVLGGNQSNAVTVTRITKSRLLGARWPLTASAPSGMRVSAAAKGKLSHNEA